MPLKRDHASYHAKFQKFSFLPPYFDNHFEQFRMQEIDQYAKQSHILLHFDIFIFENKVAGDKMQLNGQFALSRLLWNALIRVIFIAKGVSL